VECCAPVHLGRSASWLLQSSRLTLSTGVEFQLLGETGLSYRKARWEWLGLCLLRGRGPSGTVHRVASYRFPPSVGNLAFLVFNKEAETLPWFLCLREASLLAPRMADYHSVEELGSHSLAGQWELSYGRAWWSVLGLRALWGGKPPGTSRIAKPGT
jgi:hypothetical protein